MLPKSRGGTEIQIQGLAKKYPGPSAALAELCQDSGWQITLRLLEPTPRVSDSFWLG